MAYLADNERYLARGLEGDLVQLQVLVTLWDLPRGKATQQAFLPFRESNVYSEKGHRAGGWF